MESFLDREANDDFFDNHSFGAVEIDEKQSLVRNEHINESQERIQSDFKGISICTAAVFILGEMCGGGILAFPMGLSRSGLFGIILILLVLAVTVYCGHLLGQCWLKIKEIRKSQDPIRDPYSYIAELVGGSVLRHIAAAVVSIEIFLTCAVYLILASQTFHSFFSFHKGDWSDITELRIWLAIVAVLIFPFMLLGTPKDFKFVGLAAAGSIMVAVLLIWIKYVLVTLENNASSISPKSVTVKSFFTALGTYTFGFNAVFLIPNVQTDMKQPSKIKIAIFLGYFVTALLYIPTALGGYFTVNGIMKDSIAETLSHYDELHGTNKSLMIVCKVLLGIHFINGFVLYINPLSQQLEESVGIPYEFSIKRVALRGALLVSVLAVAELFPSFGPIIDLIGSSMVTLTGFILPILFYVRLFPGRKLTENVMLGIASVLAVVIGVTSTVASVFHVVDTFSDLYSKNNTATR